MSEHRSELPEVLGGGLSDCSALTDLLLRSVAAADALTEMVGDTPSELEQLRLSGKAEGVRLVIGYIEEAMR